MRTIEEIKEILGLKENGCNHCQIARKTGIPRTTVKDICHRYGDLFGLEKVLQTKEKRTKWCRFEPQRDIADNSLYSYLLGMYLGDGCISRATRCEKLRIVLDEKYPCIINETKRAIAGLVTNKVGEVKRKGCVEVFSYSQRWSSFFPQHGKGKKHQRKIELTGWQWGIVENSPQKMLRGLLHSDGCVYEKQGICLSSLFICQSF